MTVIKTSTSFCTEHELLLQDKMTEWKETRSGALRRIINEWERYDAMFHGVEIARRSAEGLDLVGW